MDIPRGHAMLPLTEGDFLDFIFNYFKAEYYPIRSFFSTAAADPRQPQRWVSMGHELAPLTFRAANAQAQKDLESLDYFVRQRNLDASFVRGIVIRFAKYEGHERLEKKLYESCRLDLMVRKALKEKHLIDTLWPSPAPKNLNKEFLQDGVKVRSWYGDMFAKYFKYLHSVDDFGLRPEVDTKIKSSGTLMLVPFVDHLVFGAVDPIMPIVAKGAGYSNAQAWKQKDNRGRSFGEPDRFEIRFDSPSDISETFMKTVVRQCRCMKCGANRDVTVAISVDPYPGPVSQQPSSGRGPSNPNVSARRHTSKAAQRYSPGYEMPRTNDTAPPKAVSSAPVQEELQEPPTPAPTQQKQCPRCTFLNHAELKACEMCSADLPESTLVSKPASPLKPSNSKASHSHTGSLPPPTTKNSAQKDGQSLRPAPPNRHSLSSTLFSIFPFSQQQQTEHHAHLPKTQPSSSEVSSPPGPDPKPVPEAQNQGRPTSKGKHAKHSHSPKAAEPDRSPSSIQDTPHTPETNPTHPSAPLLDLTPPLSRDPEMAMMPLTPPATNSQRPFPAGLPQHLMDDFVPVSPSFRTQEEEEDAGWGEMSREEAKRGDSDDESEDEVDGRKEGLVDLDVVAFEERGVWGEDSD